MAALTLTQRTFRAACGHRLAPMHARAGGIGTTALAACVRAGAGGQARALAACTPAMGGQHRCLVSAPTGRAMGWLMGGG